MRGDDSYLICIDPHIHVTRASEPTKFDSASIVQRCWQAALKRREEQGKSGCQDGSHREQEQRKGRTSFRKDCASNGGPLTSIPALLGAEGWDSHTVKGEHQIVLHLFLCPLVNPVKLSQAEVIRTI